MPIEILMPALSPTMEEGNLSKWLKNEGDKVVAGDVIAEIETDKATMEVEAVDEGTIAKIVVPAGTEGVKVNAVIAVLAVDGEDVDKAGEGIGEEPAKAEAAGASACGGQERGRSTCRGGAEDRSRRRSGHSGRHRDGLDHGARSAARRHGRGNAPRRRCLRHGRGGRRVPGRLQDHARAAAGVRAAPRRRYADHRARLCRRRRRCGDGRAEADRRVHDLQLRHAGDRPDHQLRRQDALYVRRPDGRADRLPRTERCGCPRRRPALAVLCRLVQPHSGPQGGDAVHGRRRQGPAQGGDPRSEPGHLPRKRNPLRPVLRRAEARRFRAADRQGAHPQAAARTSPSSRSASA